jgi:hypothetical protein
VLCDVLVLWLPVLVERAISGCQRGACVLYSARGASPMLRCRMHTLACSPQKLPAGCNGAVTRGGAFNGGLCWLIGRLCRPEGDADSSSCRCRVQCSRGGAPNAAAVRYERCDDDALLWWSESSGCTFQTCDQCLQRPAACASWPLPGAGR